MRVYDESPTPTPTATSTPPTPTPRPTVSCSIDEIELSQSYTSGSWLFPDCYSIRQEGRRVDYYTFTLAKAAQIRIDLESLDDHPYLHPYLYLIRGADPRGSAGWNAADDDGDERNAHIQRTLNPGSYTIAAIGKSRSYKVRVYAESPPPAPTPLPLPTVSCSIDQIELSQSYTSGSWQPSDCYSIRQEGRRVDYYTFTLAETAQIRIDLESSSLFANPYLYLIRGADPRGSNSWLERDDDDGDGRNARIQRTLNPGSYTIAAIGIGSYPYSVRVYDVDSTPPAPLPLPTVSCSIDQIELSRSYTSGSWSSSDCDSIRRAGRRVDYYTFTLAEITQVRIDLESSVDTYLYLIRGADPRGSTSWLERDDDDGDRRNARIQRTLNPGSYTIAATTYGRNRERSYSVRVYDVDSTPPTPETPPEPEPIESCSIDKIELSQSYTSGSWDSSDCYSIRLLGKRVDYYTFTLAEITQVRIDLESPVDPYLHPYLYLIRGANPRGSTSWLERDDDDGGGRNARIQRTLNPGSYTIAATTYSREGSYSVRVYNVDPTPPTPETPPEPIESCSIDKIDLSQSYTSGSWDSSDCYSIRRLGSRVDYYTFTLAEITQVRIDLESPVDPHLRPYLYLIRGADPRGYPSWLERDYDPPIQRTLNPGSYTIAATTWGRNSEGSYNVRVYNVDSTPPTPETPPEPIESCSIDKIDLSRSYTSGSWDSSDCYSIRRLGSRVDYYTFTLAEITQVRIDLESSVGTYLYLIRGADPRGYPSWLERDYDSPIQLTLNPGSYTIAATTWGNREGSYSVRVYDVDSTPPPS